MTSPGTARPARRGRPRDASIDQRLLQATRELLAEVGFAATTIQAISGRAGVPVSAIYRRWPSRIQLLEDAVSPAPPELGSPSGELRSDLLQFEGALRAAFSSPAARAAVPALLAAYQAGESGRAPEDWLRDSWRPPFAELLRVAGPAVADPSVAPDAVFDLMLGSILVQLFVPTAARRRHDPAELADLLCRTVAPR